MTHSDSIPDDPLKEKSAETRPPKPTALPVQPESIPLAMQELPQWVFWRYTWIEKKQIWDKPPFQSHGGNLADSSKPKTWSGFDAALNAYHFEGSHADGIGFMFDKFNHYVGGDLDDCRDPKTGIIQSWAQKIVDEISTYTEISTSGEGLHFIAQGELPGRGLNVRYTVDRQLRHVELYDSRRYFATTGHHLPGTPLTIEPRQEAVTRLYQYLRDRQPSSRKTSEPSHQLHGTSPYLDDDVIIQKALGARNGAKFAALWAGEINGYPSQSEADLALCRELAFWTQDAAQIRRLFEHSGLDREKWHEHPQYADWTIHKALKTTPEHYQGVSAENNGQPESDRHTSEVGDQPPLEEPPEPDVPVHLTDRGNALRLVKAHGENLHYIYRWKKGLVWDSTRWVVDEGNLVEARAKQVIVSLYAEAQATIARVSKELETGNLGEEEQKKRAKEIDVATGRLKWALKSESADRLAGMLKHARSERGIAITPEQLDANPWILNCRNGTIDLKTGTLYKHRREDLCTKRIDVDYDPDAECPHWDAFLWRIMGGPKSNDDDNDEGLNERAERAQRLINYLQRSTGYSLTGVIREQILQFMYGKGDNGKTTFSETLAALMGDYFQKAPQELLMRKARQQSNGPSPEIARLCGVRLVIAAEIDEKHRLNEAQVKDLTGDDTLTARGLYEDYFEFKPTHKIWMYGNHKPVIVGTDDAIWKRPKLIPFTEKIPKDEQKSDLREKYLLPERSGILAWAVRGCLAWQKDGLQEPPEVQAETQKYRNEMDLVAGFIQERCDVEDLCETRGSKLHGAYLQYIEGDKDARLSARKFYERLRERGFDSYVGTANKTYIIGLKLKPGADPDDADETESAGEELGS